MKYPILLLSALAYSSSSAALVEKEITAAGNTAWLRGGRTILVEFHSLTPAKRSYGLIHAPTEYAGDQIDSHLRVRLHDGVIAEMIPKEGFIEQRYSVRDLDRDGKADYIAIHPMIGENIATEAFIIIDNVIRPVPDEFLRTTEGGYTVRVVALGDYIAQQKGKNK